MCNDRLKQYVIDQTLELSPEFIKDNSAVIPLLFQVLLLNDVDVRVEKVSDLFLNFVEHITPYDVALVYLWSPGNAWFCRGLQGEIPEEIEKGDIFTSVIRDFARPMLIQNVSDERFEPEELPMAFSSMIGLPIYKDTKVIGCLELFRKSGSSFSRNDLVLIKHLLLSSENIIQQVVAPEREYDGVLDVRMDRPQKHVLMEVLHQYEELSKRMSFPLTVAIIEIEDRNKFGLYQHIPEGVRTLKTLAKRIQDGLRCYDKVLRYEELSFFVILPGCSSQHAVTALHNATLSLGEDLANNMTIGLATLPDEAQDAKGLVNIAHQALSHAKRKNIHIAKISQTGAIKPTNLSLELKMKRILESGPHMNIVSELMNLFAIQCQADDISIRYEPPGVPVRWQGYDLGYINYDGLPEDIQDWIVSYLSPAWAVALGIDTDIRNWYLSTLTTASILSDLRAGYPMGYSIKVADQMYTLAKEMGKGDVQALQWANSSLAANIGYLGVPTSIFTKGEITPFDKKKINGHTLIASRMLKDSAVLDLDDEIILYHHENIDGTGYPRGLKGEEIPLGARAMRIVDSFNAMTSPRLYRFQLETKDALKELCSMSGPMLDPDVTSLYVDLIGF